jgi:hypothetical protein
MNFFLTTRAPTPPPQKKKKTKNKRKRRKIVEVRPAHTYNGVICLRASHFSVKQKG